ncbi:flagellar protein FlaG [Pseudomonas borbori]|jgi:flagellar protein FlaG
MDIGSIRDSLKPGIKPADVLTARQQEISNASGADAEALAKQSGIESERPEKPGSRAELEKAMNNIQEFVQSVRRDINFSLDDGNGRVVVKVTDASSGDVIRQIPSEEALKLAENLSEVRSLLFKAEA